MPYIKQAQRVGLYTTPRTHAASPGELNYQFTRTILDYIDSMGLNYQTINDVVGALENAKAEFCRRIAAPYEDIKIKDNGDVYEAR